VTLDVIPNYFRHLQQRSLYRFVLPPCRQPFGKVQPGASESRTGIARPKNVVLHRSPLRTPTHPVPPKQTTPATAPPPQPAIRSPAHPGKTTTCPATSPILVSPRTPRAAHRYRRMPPPRRDQQPGPPYRSPRSQDQRRTPPAEKNQPKKRNSYRARNNQTKLDKFQ
jgi:hypothetical protein